MEAFSMAEKDVECRGGRISRVLRVQACCTCCLIGDNTSVEGFRRQQQASDAQHLCREGRFEPGWRPLLCGSMGVRMETEMEMGVRGEQ